MIYFMQPISGGTVKIGFTDDLKTRHYQLERHYGTPLAILATMEGDREKEREIHGRFSHLRYGRTEQFRPEFELMEFIGRPLLVDQNSASVEAMVPVDFDPNLKAVKIDRALAKKAQMIATDKDVSLADYLSGALRTTIEKDWAKMIRKVGGEDKT